MPGARPLIYTNPLQRPPARPGYNTVWNNRSHSWVYRLAETDPVSNPGTVTPSFNSFNDVIQYAKDHPTTTLVVVGVAAYFLFKK